MAGVGAACGKGKGIMVGYGYILGAVWVELREGRFRWVVCYENHECTYLWGKY